jgi:predicted nucleic acid-binding protein
MKTGNITPIAPFILTMEFPYVLHTLARRGDLKGDIKTAIIHFGHLSFQFIGPEYSTILYLQTLSELCTNFGISAYNAAYLELSIRINCPLLTMDKPLKKAAKKAGVNVSPRLG